MSRELEIRTPKYNLLFCKIVITEAEGVVLELKHGKRAEQLPLHAFLKSVEEFTLSKGDKLHIATK